MGFFGDFSFSAGQWGEATVGDEFLHLSIHDSDIGAIEYRPAASPAQGVCYLGMEPREYFEDPSASAPVDAASEARGLAEWARHVTGRTVDSSAIEELLAKPGLQPEEVFVEEDCSEVPSDSRRSTHRLNSTTNPELSRATQSMLAVTPLRTSAAKE